MDPSAAIEITVTKNSSSILAADVDTTADDYVGQTVLGVIRQSFSVVKNHFRHFVCLWATLMLPLCSFVLALNLAIDPLIAPVIEQVDLLHIVDYSQVLQRAIVDLGIMASISILVVLVLALLSAAALAYSVACIFAKRELRYSRMLLDALPRVCRGVLVSYIPWNLEFVFLVVAAFVAATSVTMTVVLLAGTSRVLQAVILWWPLFFFFMAPFFHLGCVFTLSGIAIAVEPHQLGGDAGYPSISHGRPQSLLCSINALYIILESALFIGYYICAYSTSVPAIKASIAIAFACLLAFAGVIGMIASNVACKSFHDQFIDYVALPENPGEYLGEDPGELDELREMENGNLETSI